MRFFTVIGILALAVAASEASILNRIYMSFGGPTTAKPTTKAPITTRAPVTTTTARPTTTVPVTTTTKATTTTARTTTIAPAPLAGPPAPAGQITGPTAGPPETEGQITGETAGPPRGDLPPGTIDDVIALFDMFTQLQGKEDEVFNAIPNNGPDPFSATLGSFAAEIQNVAQCLYALIKAHPPGTPFDFNTEMTCQIGPIVPVMTV